LPGGRESVRIIIGIKILHDVFKTTRRVSSPRKRPTSPRSGPGKKAAATRVFSEAIPSQIEMVEPVVSRALRVMTEHGCVDGQSTAAELALREALANAILHGNKSEPRKRVQLDCYQESDGTLLLVVQDEGRGFDPAAVRDPTRPENLTRTAGRGIYLIKHFMDEVEYRNRGRELRMRKKK
jgi:serine/threonine-protein kinase RsbW